MLLKQSQAWQMMWPKGVIRNMPLNLEQKAFLYLKRYGWKTKPTGISNSKLQSVADQLYRETAKIGGKGTADALRYEKVTGVLLSNKGHLIKATDRVSEIKNLISTNTLSAADLKIAQELLKDLEDAINFLP